MPGMTQETRLILAICFFVAGALVVVGIKEFVQQIRQARHPEDS